MDRKGNKRFMVSFLILNTPVMINLNTFSANAKVSLVLNSSTTFCHQHYVTNIMLATSR